MRSGFSVCAEACRCHAFLPKKLRRSRICNRKLATLLSCATSAANSSTSPERNGPPASAVGGTEAFTAFAADAAEVSGAEFPRRSSGRCGSSDVFGRHSPAARPVNRARGTTQCRNCQDGECTLAHAFCVNPIPNNRLPPGLPSYNKRDCATASCPDSAPRVLSELVSFAAAAIRSLRTSIEEDFLHALRGHRRRWIYWLEHRGRTRPPRRQRGCARRSFRR